MSVDKLEAEMKAIRAGNRRWLLSVALASVFVFVAITLWQPSFSTEDQRELNYLNSVLHDLDEPSAANATVRRIECADADKKAERYLKVNAPGVRDKVARYLDGCRPATRDGGGL